MRKVSVICCARDQDDSAGLNESLFGNCGLTPGKEYELLEQVGYRSMGVGYNLGFLRSTSEVCVFTHTDVRLWAGRSLWRDMVARVMDGEGFVGVAGSTVLDDTGIWWQAEGAVKRGAVAHTSNGQIYVSSFGPFGPVCVLDGVFLAARRDLLERLGPWPEDTGFHFYDIEMTLRAHLGGAKNEVVPLPLYHGSVGATPQAWYSARSVFLERCGGRLPVKV